MRRYFPFATVFVFLLLFGLAAVRGKPDEREQKKAIVDMEFCGEDDCYKILNITTDSTRGEVKRGYHKMSLLYHPDKLGDKSAEEQAAGNAMFIKVSQAYAVLADEGSRRKYDLWVRGGRKRRPEPGDDDMGPMPSYYRDDSVRDVQDTPAAIAAVWATLIISIGVPLCLQLQGKRKKNRRPPVEKKEKNAEPAVPQVSRKERRGEREARDPSTLHEPTTADIVAVSTTQDTGVHSQNTHGTARAITKVSGPWSPEEEMELVKAVAKFPGGTLERWSKIAGVVGSRTEQDCMARAALLKGVATTKGISASTSASSGAGGGGGGVGGNVVGSAGSVDARSEYAVKRGWGGGEGANGVNGEEGVGGKKGRGGLAKMPVAQFAKLCKEKEKEKAEKEKEREAAKRAAEGRGQEDEKRAGKAEDKAWTAEEQMLLERAMRSVDKSLEDRWDRIAEMVPNRTRKEVIARVRDLKKQLAGPT